MNWVGWFRRHRTAKWEKACEAATIGECAKLLTEKTRSMRLKNSDTILTGGAYPFTRPAAVNDREVAK
jgi:hypothetical protein